MTDLHGIDPATFDKVIRRAIARLIAFRHQDNNGLSDEERLGVMEAAAHLSNWRHEVAESHK